MKKAPELLTEEEVNKLLVATSDKIFYYTLFRLARVTGRRLGEFYGVEDKILIGEKVLDKTKKVYAESGKQIEVHIKRKIYKKLGTFKYGLQVKDFLFQKDGTGIMKTWVLKRGNYQQDESILPVEVCLLVKRFIREYKLKLDDHMFRKVTYRAIQNAPGRFAKKAGLTKNVSFHSFRHFTITQLLKKDWSYNKIQKVTGHRSIQSIQAYDHVISRDLKEDLLRDLK